MYIYNVRKNNRCLIHCVQLDFFPLVTYLQFALFAVITIEKAVLIFSFSFLVDVSEFAVLFANFQLKDLLEPLAQNERIVSPRLS